MLEIRPTHLKPAREFVGKYHRHNIPPVGGKFAISCFESERLCGVAICGRPTARKLDDGATLEIYRNCTDGTRNACTKLYGACVRIARDMGYKKVITYTLESENGASLRAANFTFAGSAGGIASCGWEAAEAARRREYVKEHGLTLCADGFRRLIIKKENDMATPYKECPHCGAHLDSGEKCDCRAAGNPVALENVVDLERQTRENNKAMNRVLDFIAPEK